MKVAGDIDRHCVSKAGSPAPQAMTLLENLPEVISLEGTVDNCLYNPQLPSSPGDKEDHRSLLHFLEEASKSTGD